MFPATLSKEGSGSSRYGNTHDTIPQRRKSSGFSSGPGSDSGARRPSSSSTTQYIDAEIDMGSSVNTLPLSNFGFKSPKTKRSSAVPVASTSSVQWRKSIRPQDTPISRARRSGAADTFFRRATMSQDSDLEDEEDVSFYSDNIPDDLHAVQQQRQQQKLQQQQQQQHQHQYDNQQDYESPRSRQRRQEAAQRVPESHSHRQESDEDEGDGQEYRMGMRNTMGDNDEGVDIGGNEDELYPHRGSPHHDIVPQQDPEDDYTEDELTPEQLAQEEAERKREKEQIGFLERVTNYFWSQMDDLGASTTAGSQEQSLQQEQEHQLGRGRRKHAHIDSEDSDNSLTSARTRSRKSRSRSKTRGPLSFLKPSMPETSIFNVPSMRHLDSGIGMTSWMEERQRGLSRDGDVSLRAPSGRPTSSGTRQQAPQEHYSNFLHNQHATNNSLHAPRLRTFSREFDQQHHDQFSSSTLGMDNNMGAPVQRRPQAPQRVYPWHVLWRWVTIYIQKISDFYLLLLKSIQSCFWAALSLLQSVLLWPWRHRYSIRIYGERWLRAGASIGLLRPGTLLGLMALGIFLMGGHWLGLQKETNTDGLYYHNGTKINDGIQSSKSWIKESVTSTWKEITWRSPFSSSTSRKKNSKIEAWRDWVPKIHSPSRPKSTKTVLPTEQIRSLEELESRIELIQQALEELGQADEQTGQDLQEKIDAMMSIIANVDRRVTAVDDKVHKVDHRVSVLDDTLDKVEHRLTTVDGNFGKVDHRMASVDVKLGKVEGRMTDVEDQVEDVSTRLDKVAKEVESLKAHVSSGQWIEQTVLELLRNEIPKYLVVSKDARSGTLVIPSEFWETARELFMTKAQVQESLRDHTKSLLENGDGYSDGDSVQDGERVGSGSGWPWSASRSKNRKSSSWKSFLQENERALEAFVDGRMTKVSQATFLDLVRTEADQIWQSVESKVVALLEKRGRLQGKVAPSRLAKEPTRALTDVEQALISKLIDEALEKYSADVMAKPDYALFSAGGRIIPRLTSANYYHDVKPSLLGRLGLRFLVPLPRREKPAEKAIEPDLHAGECWAMNGQEGQLAIRLARKIVVTEITIEHADASVVLDMGSAAKEIEVWSLKGSGDAAPVSARPASFDSGSGAATNAHVSEQHTPEQEHGYEQKKQEREQRPLKSEQKDKTGKWWNTGAPWPGAVLLSTIEFDADMSATHKPKSRQTFSIPMSKQNSPSVGVVLRIKSNWGHPQFTCLYRVRVHERITNLVSRADNSTWKVQMKVKNFESEDDRVRVTRAKTRSSTISKQALLVTPSKIPNAQTANLTDHS
ncbi:hypothetical protein BGZ94_001430 [Podila epigama]|nr:hypothetical protein BGZ94_001430 [Podila epigama]